MNKTVSTREELQGHLCELASTAFYANAPRDGGEFVFACDEDSGVEKAQSQLEGPFAAFFQEAPEAKAEPHLE